MKKVILSMAILFSSALYASVAEPMPIPAIDFQTLRSVQSFSGYFLQYILLLLQRLAPLQSEDREIIRGAFIAEVFKAPHIPQRYDDCDAIAINVIKAKVFNETWSEANKYLYEPAPSKIANLMVGNVQSAFNKNGIDGYVIAPYMGNDLRTKVINTVRHPAYDQYRR